MILGFLVKSVNDATWATSYGSSSYVIVWYFRSFWSYDSVGLVLKHFNSSFALSSSVVVNGLCGFGSDTSTDGVWRPVYFKSLVHINSSCVTTVTRSLGEPYQVCDALNDGCWVIDLNDSVYGKTIKNYSSFW